MSQTARICIFYTGGTIGMQKTSDGYAPVTGYLERQMAALSEFHNPALPAYEVREFDPLLDSSNMSPVDWLKIAYQIAAEYHHFDGFVVIHGTDTMTYTASALSFLLDGLRKPVILTGSQIPLCEVRNDAIENLITALLIAGSYPIPEVCLYFGGRLLRGCRAVKVNASGLTAFDSPNYPHLGSAGVDLAMNWYAISSPTETEMPVRIENHAIPLVGVLKLYPGINAAMIRAFLESPTQGAVLETYGVGTAPDNDLELVAALHQASQRGVVLVAVTQCRQGTVSLDSYATGSNLARAGVVGGADMTTEAALTKLFYLFGKGCTPEQVRSELPRSLRGELTPAWPGWVKR